MKAKNLVLLALCVITQVVANAQFTTNTITPAEAVALLINDPNIVVSNITYTGAPAQLGSMTGFTGTNFQISDAVILSTDDANQIGDFSITSNSIGMGGVDGDADLLTIANSVPPLIFPVTGIDFSVGAVNDVAILEFDFVPTGDVVSFNYIFGSDEYLTYVNSSFNDVFAFLISGPGITGPYAAPSGFPGGSANIAFVPETSPELPITISSVNDQLNSQYFVDNSTTVTNPNIQLNGYTVTMVATTSVTCGETYHIRLAIADGSDHWLNSVVCLQAGSFEVTTNVDLTPAIQDPSSTLPYATFLEGCIDGALVVSPPCQFNTQEVTVILGGSATNGVDYQLVGSPVITLIPSEDISLAFTTFDDNNTEGVELINVSFIYVNIDGVIDTASADVAIVDQTPMILSIQDQVICEGSTIAIDATPAGGFGTISYLWNDESTGNLNILGEFGNYTVTVTDLCGKSVQANFNILAPDTLLINLPDSLGVCPSGSVDYTAQAVGGINPYTYTWSVGGVGEDITFTAFDAGYVFVNVLDDCNKTATDSMKIYLPEPFSVDPILEICLDDDGLIAPHGGSYPLSFDYDHEILTSAVGGVYVGKKLGQDYVVVTDACGEMDSVLVSVVICNTEFYDIISPNGDGKNDTFEIKGIDHFQRSELTIWNRWGTEVYHSLSYANTWAAQDANDGTYFWQLIRSDGKKFSGIVTVVDSAK